MTTPTKYENASRTQTHNFTRINRTSANHKAAIQHLFSYAPNLEYEPLLPLQEGDVEHIWTEVSADWPLGEYQRAEHFLISATSKTPDASDDATTGKRKSKSEDGEENENGTFIGFLLLHSIFKRDSESNVHTADFSFFLDRRIVAEGDEASVLTALLEWAFTGLRGSESIQQIDAEGGAIGEVSVVSTTANTQLLDVFEGLGVPVRLRTSDEGPAAVYFVSRREWKRSTSTNGNSTENGDLSSKGLVHRHIPLSTTNAPFTSPLSNLAAAISTTTPMHLEPVDLHSATQFAELGTQRIACGWFFEDAQLTAWRRQMDDDLVLLFWIYLPDLNVRAGHVAYDRISPGSEAVQIVRLFVLHEYRSGGLASRAMEVLENRARKDPKVKRVELDSTDPRYHTLNTYAWGGAWLRGGLPAPRSVRSTAEWYARRGYRPVRYCPKYEEVLVTGEFRLIEHVDMALDVSS